MSGNQMILLGGSQAPAVDPFFYSVTSLLHGDGTNGGQNNTFLDSSTNNFTITRNGNTTQGSFSPFSQTGWSNYFDGTGDYLTAPDNAAYAFGTGDFTVECWVFTGTSATQCVAGQGDSTGTRTSRSFLLYASLTGNPYFTVGHTGNNSVDLTSSSALPLNQWNHIAGVRDGATLRLYLNGVQVATGNISTASANDSTNAMTIGRSGDYNGEYLTGYCSNLRVIKGTCLYPSGTTFTPSITPLTAITNTSLLTCQANRFLDASSNAFAITRNGDVSVQPFSPFNPTTPYSTSSIGGSGYFDGSGDYLTVANSSNYALGSDNFTIELWVYPTATFASDQVLFSHGYVSFCPWLMYTSSSGGLVGYASSTGSSWDILSGNSFGTLRTGAWNHVALCRSGSTFYLCMNGVVTTTATSSAALMSIASGLMIGATTSGLNIIGSSYITNARIIKGSALYTTSYTPPTAPLTAVSGTQFLLSATNGAIFDNAAVADYETVGNAQISTSVKKYGTGSMAFDGTGDYLLTDPPSAQLMAFGTGDFTVEMWVYFNAIGTNVYHFYDSRPASTDGAYPTLRTNASSQLEYVANSAVRITGLTLTTNTWYHVALCRTASQTKLFVNGTQTGSTYADTTNYLNAAARPLIGGSGFHVTTLSLNGYVDDVRISKGIARYPYNFTPPTAEFPNIGGTVTLTADPYFDYTTLLLPGNGTNGAQNNTFLDSSTNNFTITRNGNTTQGTFSPFSQTGWGNYFDGTSGQFLNTVANTAFNFGTGDFTVEGWVYPTSTSGTRPIVEIRTSAANSTGFALLSQSGATTLNVYTNGGFAGASTGSLATNQWNHVALVRSGNTWTYYINGTSSGSFTNSSTQSDGGTTGPKIAGSTTAGEIWIGYISNIRIVKGTAVYTSNFTPSTTPLTAISGTSLLTCQSNRFLDNSSNAFAITTSGSPSVQAFSPFNPTAAWSASTNGGSGYFDGSGDYLDFPTSSAFTMGTGDFTIELWYYPSVNYVSGNGYLFDLGSNGTRVQLFNNQIYFVPVAGSGVTGSAGVGVLAGTWYHIACVRSGSTITVYLNGTSIGSVSNSSNLTDNDCRIGEWGGGTAGPFNGYISSLRIVKGTAVYTAAFTPPTAPLTAITNTSLLTNYTNAGIYDATSKNDLETVGNAQISTTQSKFGGSSMAFDGTGDYLYGKNTRLMDIGSGDFTIEGWLYPTTSGTTRAIVSQFNTNGTGPGWTSYLKTTNVIEFYGGSGTITVTGTGAVSANAWSHFAICRYGSTITIYVNGVAGGSGTNSSFSDDTTGPVEVGARGGAGAIPYTGYIDDLRITKGIARYTSNFTPPTTAFLTL